MKRGASPRECRYCKTQNPTFSKYSSSKERFQIATSLEVVFDLKMKRILFIVLALAATGFVVGEIFKPPTTQPIEQETVEEAKAKVVVAVNTKGEQLNYELENVI